MKFTALISLAAAAKIPSLQKKGLSMAQVKSAVG